MDDYQRTVNEYWDRRHGSEEPEDARLAAPCPACGEVVSHHWACALNIPGNTHS